MISLSNKLVLDSLGRTLLYLFFLSAPGGMSLLVADGLGSFYIY